MADDGPVGGFHYCISSESVTDGDYVALYPTDQRFRVRMWNPSTYRRHIFGIVAGGPYEPGRIFPVTVTPGGRVPRDRVRGLRTPQVEGQTGLRRRVRLGVES